MGQALFEKEGVRFGTGQDDRIMPGATSNFVSGQLTGLYCKWPNPEGFSIDTRRLSMNLNWLES